MIKGRLLERLSLLGICHLMGVSIPWLLSFIAELYEALPDDLHLRFPLIADGRSNPCALTPMRCGGLSVKRPTSIGSSFPLTP